MPIVCSSMGRLLRSFLYPSCWLVKAADHPISYTQTLVLYRKRTGATGSVGLDLRSSLSIQPFEGSRFVRGGRYGISIDFGLEVVENKSTCGASFKSKFIDLTMKPRLTIASS